MHRMPNVAPILLAMVGAGGGMLNAAAAPKPNIILFLVDDMGWMDSTVYGSRYYETPNMERLAKRSMMFTNAYAANPLCSPTRASIMSGQYPARLGITSAVGHLPPRPKDAPLFAEKAAPTRRVLLPQSKRYLEPSIITIAERLRAAGYRTAHLGKWHLGLNPEHWPERQGFEVSFHGAPDPGPKSYFSPYQFKAGTVTDGPPGEYIADRLTDEAIQFMRAHRDEPFYLNLWHYNVHGPWGAKQELIDRNAGRRDPRGKQGNPIMAAMLKSVDESLGRIMDTLDELGIAGRTILIFFSDNGGNVHSNTRDDARTMAIKPGHPRWQQIQQWRKYAGYLPPTNNAPLRAGKATIFEGGTREPMMVCWPGVVQPGSRSDEIVSSVDFYPTMLEMAGLRRGPQTLDGESLVPVLKQTGKLKRSAIFCHFPHGFGKRSPAATYVRQGDWKLIHVWEVSEFFPDEFMLYNLKDDIGETHNLAAQRLDKVRELDALIQRFLEDTHAAVPIPNPAYDPSLRPVYGWRPQTGTKISLRDGALHIESGKTRPFIHTSEVPEAQGRLRVKLRLRAEGGVGGRLYWSSRRQRGFAAERRVDLHPKYDGQWHEYEATFDVATPLTGLRIDPSLKACAADLDWVRVYDAKGRLMKAWEFED